MGLNTNGALKANFITCYQADNSMDKIRKAPIWSKEDYLIERDLKRKNR
ncbi:hypothetical protein QUF61_16960 [Candidatus Venteria ishoeyi]|nr:hypothetical protein [Candidatus Venteria ishoeyi]MDM8548182.1 hypothetical protein [Candidatus Venteria ishoeyi]